MAAKFVLEKGTGGSFRFRLMSQGRVLATSETYSTKRAAQNAIASIQSGVSAATVEDTTDARSSRPATRRPRTATKATRVAKKVESAVKTVKRRAPSTAKSLVAPARAPAKKTARKTAGAKRAAPTTTVARPRKARK